MHLYTTMDRKSLFWSSAAPALEDKQIIYKITVCSLPQVEDGNENEAIGSLLWLLRKA